jgi:hypothetical protein
MFLDEQYEHFCNKVRNMDGVFKTFSMTFSLAKSNSISSFDYLTVCNFTRKNCSNIMIYKKPKPKDLFWFKINNI